AAQPVAALQQVPLAVGPNNYRFSVLRAQLPGGAPAYLIDCPALYARTALYTSDPDEHLRFLAFTRAALTACQRLGWAPQVLHCNDWHTAFAPLLLRTAWEDEPLFASTRTLLTIHNIGYQGMFEALPKTLSARPLSFVALGNGEPQYEEFFTALARRFPGRVVFHCGYDEELAHWIEAASDLFLMPSRYEPCGLNQMYSLRYGTVPVVRRTGGLADSVQHYDTRTGTGTGVVFNDFNTQALQWALNTALDLYATPRHWARVVRNGMQQDFSWERQGGEYVALYRRLIAG